MMIDRMRWSKGYAMESHVHSDHEHVILVVEGTIRVVRDGRPAETYAAPAMIWLPIGVRHGYEALTDSIVVNLRYTDLSENGIPVSLAQYAHLGGQVLPHR